MTVTGIGNYSGRISTDRTSFKITGWDQDSLQALRAEIPDQAYTGKALKPQVAFYIEGTADGEKFVLKPGTAVKIAYKDNKDAGTATATITGKGELADMKPIKVTFTIEQADISGATVGKVKNQTLKGVAATPVPKVKIGRKILKADRDFKVKYMLNGVKGEAMMTITGTGNYTGVCHTTFIIQ